MISSNSSNRVVVVVVIVVLVIGSSCSIGSLLCMGYIFGIVLFC